MPRKLLDIETCADAYETMKDADGLVLLTEWNEFRALNLVRVGKLLKRRLIVDLRNIYAPGADAGLWLPLCQHRTPGARPAPAVALAAE